MAMVVLTTLLAIFLSLFIKIAYDTLSCYFLNPRRIKKIMEKQGVRGPKPRPLIGNVLDMASFVAKTTSHDMNSINHDIVGRLLPHYVAWSKQYGKRFIFWNGVEPRMCLTETKLIKELLSKYSTMSGRSWQRQQGSKHFTGRGVLMANGKDWYHQRHIVAPAFMGDRLKRKMYRSELRLQCLSLVLLFVLVPRLLSDARPLNPSMEVEGKKKQSLSNSTFEAPVEIPTGGSSAMYFPPSHIGNHEMSSSGQGVHGGEYLPLDKGLVPPSAPNPSTDGPDEKLKNKSDARPLNPSMVVEGKKKQSLSNSTFEAPVEIPAGGSSAMYFPPSHIGNHEMSSAGQGVHDGEYLPLDKGLVPPSAPNPSTDGPDEKLKNKFDARPLNPSMEVEGKKKQSLSNSTFEAPVEIPAGGPSAMYFPPSHIGNHEMSSAGQGVHGGEYLQLDKGLVPSSAPNPSTDGPDEKLKNKSEARPLNPSMEVEGKKKQSLSNSTFEAPVEIPARGSSAMYFPPSHIGNHEMSSAGQGVHGGEYLPLDKGLVPPSAPNPSTDGPDEKLKNKSDARPLNPSMEVEGKKKQFLSNSTFEAPVEIPAGGLSAMYFPPSHIGNHEMSSAGQGVHGGEYLPLDKGQVPPSAPNPSTDGPDEKLKNKSDARPLNPSMEVEGKKKQFLSNSTFEAPVEIPAGGPSAMYFPPSHIGNHEMSSAGQGVHGGEYLPLDKGLVPPSAPNPSTDGLDEKLKNKFDARPLNPSMEVEGKKKQSLSNSTFEAPVEIPAGGPSAMYFPHSHIGNHEMSSAGQGVHGGEYLPLDKGLVPPSAPNPSTDGPDEKLKNKFDARPLNPSMEVEGKKKQSLSNSTFEAPVEIPAGGSSAMYFPPSHIGNHEMSSAGQGVQGGEYLPLDKGLVPSSAPNPSTDGPDEKLKNKSDARPLNPSMEVEGKKKQSLSNSTFEAPVEIPAGGPSAMYFPPSHIGNHEMSSAGQGVHGGEYLPLDKGLVPPSAPNPSTDRPDEKLKNKSDARPLIPSMEVEGKKKQSLSNSTFEAPVEIPAGGPSAMYFPPHIGNHEMSSAGQGVHGGEYLPLDKGQVPPSARNPSTDGLDEKLKNK